MCERVWRIAQVYAKKQGLAVGSREWLAAASRQNDAYMPSMPEAEVLHQLLHYRKKVPGWPSCLLSTQPSHEVKLPEHPVWEILTFHIPSHLTIYIPLYPRFRERSQREFWERNPREKQDWLIHNLYLRDFSNSSTFFLSIVKSLRGLLPKPFLTISIFVRGLFGALGSS